MFSKGTFQRYLFEIESRQQKMLDVYTRLAAETSDPDIHDAIAGFIDQLQVEQKTVGGIQASLAREG